MIECSGIIRIALYIILRLIYYAYKNNDMNKLERQIKKIMGDKVEYVMKLSDCMIDIQLNRKQERLTIYGLDIKQLEELGLKLWNINYDCKTITMDIVK